MKATFKPEGLEVFDVRLDPKPERLSQELAEFWGGYDFTFKLIKSERFTSLGPDPDTMRRNALMIGAKGKFEIDISKFEYCCGKKAENLERLSHLRLYAGNVGLRKAAGNLSANARLRTGRHAHPNFHRPRARLC